jgi:two-component system response regulator DesR
VRVIRVAVVEEHEIFRLGVVAALRADPRIEVVLETSGGTGLPANIDVAVVSPRAAAERRFGCPVIVLSGSPGPLPLHDGNRLCAALSRGPLTADQLTAAVRAAVAGLRILPSNVDGAGRLDPRSVQVLRLLAGGADTTEISRSLQYSPRTIKSWISGIEQRLGARNRTHAVAEGIRRGLI